MVGALSLALTLVSGVCWTVAYVELIRLGLRDRTYGMPQFALALNIAWEGLYAALGLRQDPGGAQTWVNVVWCALDLGIVYTYLRFGREDFPKSVDSRYFWPWSALIFTMAITVQLALHAELGPHGGETYAAFIQNLVMSVLFITMLVHRGHTRGQSRTIAVAKWLGTLAPTLLAGVLLGNALVLTLGLFCSVFDLIYIGLLSAALRAERAKPTVPGPSPGLSA